MTTVAALRTTYLNTNIRRTDGSGTPWTDAQCDRAIIDALRALWDDGVGKRATGTVATSQASDVYTIPAALQSGRISRVELVETSGGETALVGHVTSWQYATDTTVRIRPRLPTSAALALHFFGYVPFADDGSDLPVRLEPVVGFKAAALAYGQELGQLANSQLQTGLDEGRVVDYPTAVGMSAYWERRYVDSISRTTYQTSFAPRRARR